MKELRMENGEVVDADECGRCGNRIVSPERRGVCKECAEVLDL